MNKPKSILSLTLLAVVLTFSGCGDDDPLPVIEAPATYDFTRNGQSTVSFTGQTTRIQMGEELIRTLLDFNASAETMLAMYRNADATGGDVNPFDNADLNSATKSIKSKVAASRDYFSANTAEGAQIKADFERWINAQVTEVFPNEQVLASPGVAGQIADGTSVRYVNGKGLEYNQAVNKGLIGALMLDQALNNYLSTSVLDEADNRANNNNGIVADGQNYTTMEHKWDEAYGYLYGTSVSAADPNASIGADDSFLNKYLGRVEGDSDFSGIADEILDAFKLGRAAIVAGEYELRDRQAAIISQKLSEIIAIRAVYYLQQARLVLEGSNPAYGTAFHDLSEGFGFIYSLRFTRNGSGMPYFNRNEVDQLLDQLMADTNGWWDINPAVLDDLSNTIASRFDFTVAQAGSSN